MAKPRLINVFVCDKDGYALSGQKVMLYGGEYERTGSDGMISLLADGDKCTVYVNGRTAYDGSVSRIPDPLIWKIS